MFKAIGKFFKNIFKDIGKLITVVLQAVVIAIAIVSVVGVAFVPVFVAVLTVGLIALGTENSFLLKLFAVAALIASVYISFGMPGGFYTGLEGFVAGQGLGGTWFGQGLLWYNNLSGWYHAAGFAYSAMSTAAMFRSVDDGSSFGSAFMSVLSETTTGVVEVVGGVVGSVVGGLFTGVGKVLSGSGSNFLLTCVAGFIGYKYLTRPKGTEVTINKEIPPNAATS